MSRGASTSALVTLRLIMPRARKRSAPVLETRSPMPTTGRGQVARLAAGEEALLERRQHRLRHRVAAAEPLTTTVLPALTSAAASGALISFIPGTSTRARAAGAPPT